MERSSETISTEEQDYIDCSTKKLKQQMMFSKIQMVDVASNLPVPSETSYRDKLMRDSFDGSGKSISQTLISFNLDL